jgi:hypothetical protein
MHTKSFADFTYAELTKSLLKEENILRFIIISAGNRSPTCSEWFVEPFGAMA